MQTISLILYGSPQARTLARDILVNLQQVKREESSRHPWEVRLTLFSPIKETSLIPLLRQSGILGFRLVE